jgi:hypothetical protein
MPHDTVAQVVRRVVGEGRFSQVTYHEPDLGMKDLADLAYLTEMTVEKTRAEKVLVADWDHAVGAQIADFLGRWPSLRDRVKILLSTLPRRTRHVMAPMVIMDGIQDWSDGYALRDLLEASFGISCYHLLLVPGCTTGLAAHSPTRDFVAKQIQLTAKSGSLDGVLVLQSFPRDYRARTSDPQISSRISELRRSHAMIKSLMGDQSILIAAVLVDESGRPVSIDRNPLSD